MDAGGRATHDSRDGGGRAKHGALAEEAKAEAGKNCSRQFCCISFIHEGQNPELDLLIIHYKSAQADEQHAPK